MGVVSLLATSGMAAEDVLTSDTVLVKKPYVLKRLVSQVCERRASAASEHNTSLNAFFE